MAHFREATTPKRGDQKLGYTWLCSLGHRNVERLGDGGHCTSSIPLSSPRTPWVHRRSHWSINVLGLDKLKKPLGVSSLVLYSATMLASEATGCCLQFDMVSRLFSLSIPVLDLRFRPAVNPILATVSVCPGRGGMPSPVVVQWRKSCTVACASHDATVGV
ncbi:uncharacterized protein B0I36DRAFT_76875 [Microdochium trichocladiopsis]|uniref:Uncharacterized protein n=1 Tax=Microdochium trichocladiopsis TaxID=1682393 RepID=A0A9P8YHT2_9PEZI|nr:uncharacterized protein B0I36DRAFT_76875 [Microdochium trichocladiopsis]KAH7038199.1 hypothetical protein B0I36DRAFT_76875 [Microdochium trichocladiopsis]